MPIKYFYMHRKFSTLYAVEFVSCVLTKMMDNEGRETGIEKKITLTLAHVHVKRY